MSAGTSPIPSRVPQWDLVGVQDVGAITTEDGMGLVPDDEGDVSGDLAGHPVPLLVEGHLGAGLPARLYVDLKHLLLISQSSVIVTNLPGYLHFLLGTLGDFLQADWNLPLNSFVLHLGLFAGTLAVRVKTRGSAKPSAASSVADAPDELLYVNVHPIMTLTHAATWACGEERGKGIAASKELRECCPGVSVIGVAEALSWSKV